MFFLQGGVVVKPLARLLLQVENADADAWLQSTDMRYSSCNHIKVSMEAAS